MATLSFQGQIIFPKPPSQRRIGWRTDILRNRFVGCPCGRPPEGPVQTNPDLLNPTIFYTFRPRMKEWIYWSWPERRTVRFVPNSGQVPFIIIWFAWRIFLWSQFVLTGSSGGRQRAMLNISLSYAAPQNSTQEKTSSETQGQSVGSGETARRKFFFIWKIKPWFLIMITINFKIKRCHYLNSVFTAVVIFVA